MPENPGSSTLDRLTKVVAFISLVIGVAAALKALPLDAELKRLQAETTRLDLALKQADADLKGIESSRKLSFELYEEVKRVIEMKEKNAREEEALCVLIEVLADDPFRQKLLQVMALGASDTEVKRTAAASAKFYEEESVVQAAVGVPALTAPVPTKVGAFDVDIFYCEHGGTTARGLAERLYAQAPPGHSGRWRVRALPESINKQAGYRIRGNEIRYTPPGEAPIAKTLQEMLGKQGVKATLKETTYATPNYVSVFICP